MVDEVDSILIDEARTPLIISGQAEDHTELYVRMNDVVPPLLSAAGRDGEGRRATTGSTRRRTRCYLSEAGHEHAEEHPGAGRACWPRARASTTRPTSR
ncbi:MAG: hypothetical protein MZW92_01240 [Comamonadaceae bacterium]|nr:hypothetical protein [Comamonadaceae bacterium]